MYTSKNVELIDFVVIAILLEKYNNLTEKTSNSPFIPQDSETFKYKHQLYQELFTCQQALTKRFFMENTQCPANSGRGGVHFIIHIVAMTTAAMPVCIQFDLNTLAESPLIAKTKAKKFPGTCIYVILICHFISFESTRQLLSCLCLKEFLR